MKFSKILSWLGQLLGIVITAQVKDTEAIKGVVAEVKSANEEAFRTVNTKLDGLATVEKEEELREALVTALPKEVVEQIKW
jgi:hypothetical protein